MTPLRYIFNNNYPALKNKHNILMIFIYTILIKLQFILNFDRRKKKQKKPLK